MASHSSRTSRSSARPPQRRPPGSWTRPSRHATTARAATPQKKSTGTPTCCSRCTYTSTAWRRAGKGEVSTATVHCFLHAVVIGSRLTVFGRTPFTHHRSTRSTSVSPSHHGKQHEVKSGVALLGLGGVFFIQ